MSLIDFEMRDISLLPITLRSIQESKTFVKRRTPRIQRNLITIARGPDSPEPQTAVESMI